VYEQQSVSMNMMMSMIRCCHLSNINRNSDDSGDDDDYVYICCVVVCLVGSYLNIVGIWYVVCLSSVSLSSLFFMLLWCNCSIGMMRKCCIRTFNLGSIFRLIRKLNSIRTIILLTCFC